MLTALFNSSVISAARFDESLNTLEVDLTNDRTYRYFLVPRECFESLIAAKSAGKYFNAQIRNRFNCERVK